MHAFAGRDSILDSLRQSRPDVNVDAYIVDRIQGALHIMRSQVHNEEQRQHQRIILTAVAPELVKERSKTGMQRPVAERLGIDRNLAECTAM